MGVLFTDTLLAPGDPGHRAETPETGDGAVTAVRPHGRTASGTVERPASGNGTWEALTVARVFVVLLPPVAWAALWLRYVPASYPVWWEPTLVGTVLSASVTGLIRCLIHQDRGSEKALGAALGSLFSAVRAAVCALLPLCSAAPRLLAPAGRSAVSLARWLLEDRKADREREAAERRRAEARQRQEQAESTGVRRAEYERRLAQLLMRARVHYLPVQDMVEPTYLRPQLEEDLARLAGQFHPDASSDFRASLEDAEREVGELCAHTDNLHARAQAEKNYERLRPLIGAAYPPERWRRDVERHLDPALPPDYVRSWSQRLVEEIERLAAAVRGPAAPAPSPLDLEIARECDRIDRQFPDLGAEERAQLKEEKAAWLRSKAAGGGVP